MRAMAPVAGGRASMDAFAAGLMVLLTFIWGFNQVAVKVSADGYSPLFLTSVRSAIGLGVILLWCRLRSVPLFARDGTLLPGLAAGLLFGLEFVLIYWGIAYTTAARAALMINTMPLFVALGAHLLLGERLTAAKIAGLVVAFSGVALVFSDRLSLPSPDALFGDVLCLLAGAAWAATTLVIRGTRLRHASGEKTLAYQLAVSAMMLVPLMPFGGAMVRDPTALATASLLFQGLFVVGVTFAVWFWMVRTYPTTGLASFTFLTPIFGVACGAVLLGDPVTWRVAAGLVLVVAGLVLVNRPARRVRPAGGPVGTA